MDKNIEVSDKPPPNKKTESRGPVNALRAPEQRPKTAESEAGPAENNGETVITETPRQTPETGKNEIDAKPDIKADDDSPEKDALAAAIAFVLNVPVETVIDLLKDLGLQPADLSVKTNLSLFIRELYQIEDPVEMLKIPDILAIMSEVEDIANGAERTPETGALVETANIAAKNTVNVTNAAAAERPKAAAGHVPLIIADEPEAEPAEIEIDPEISETGPAQEAKPRRQISDETPERGQNDDISRKPEMEQPAIAEENNAGIFAHQTIRPNNIVTEQVRQPAAVQQDIVNQITDAVRVEVRGGVTEVRLLLRPESLGEVSLKIATQNGIVTAQFVAENQRVREIIEANFDELKDVLAQRGVEVSALSVSVGSGETNEAAESFLRESGRTAARAGRIIAGLEEEATGVVTMAAAAEAYGSTVEYTA